MFAVIYKFRLEHSQEETYKKCWNKVANYFIKTHGALGSCLHNGENGLWLAYSRWPSKVMRDAVWSPDNPLEQFPKDIQEAIKQMNEFKKLNEITQHSEEICLEVIDDLLQ